MAADNQSNGTILTEINHEELLLKFDDLVARCISSKTGWR
jgi:hypothetical protein